MNAALIHVCERLLSALGNSLVQGLLVGLAVWVALRVMRGANAATRHAVQFAALLVVGLLPVVNLISGSAPLEAGMELPKATASLRASGSRAGSDDPPRGDGAAADSGEEPRPDGASGLDFYEAAGGHSARHLHLSEADVSREESLPPEDSNSSRAEVAAADTGLDLAVAVEIEMGMANGPEELQESATVETPVPDVSWLVEMTDRLNAWRATRNERRFEVASWAAVGLVSAWLLLAGGRLMLLVLQVLTLRRFKSEVEPVPAGMAESYAEVRRRTGATRAAAVGICPAISSPMAAGFAHPMILLPARFAEASPADWERVLRHELAHLSRRDDWTNLAQQTLRAVFFFHPVILWLSRRLTVDREIACDDHVLSATGRAREYALFLTDFARRNHGREWSAAPAAWSNPSQLKERIHMLLDSKRNASPRLARGGAGAWITAVLLVAALGLYAAPRLSFAGTAGTENKNTDAAPAGGAETRTSTEVRVSVDAAGATPALDVVTDEGHEAPGADGSDPNTPPKRKGAKKERTVTITATDDGRVHVLKRDGVTVRSDSRLPQAQASAGSATLPVPPTPPTPTAPPAPAAGRAPMPFPEPAGPVAPPMAMHRSSAGDDSVERRIERLEKLVESLARSSGNKSMSGSEGSESSRPLKEKSITTDPGRAEPFGRRAEFEARVKSGLASLPSFDGLGPILAEVARQIEQATREAERAVQEAMRSAKLAAEAKDAPPQREEIDAKRRALDAERRALQKQIARVEAQLGKLDGQLDRVDGLLDQQVEAAETTREHQRLHNRAIAERERAIAKARSAADKPRAEHPSTLGSAEHDLHPDIPPEPPRIEKLKEKVKVKDKGGDPNFLK